MAKSNGNKEATVTPIVPSTTQAADAKPNRFARTNEHLKWKPRAQYVIKHLMEKFPESAKHASELLKFVDKLHDDYAPNEQSPTPKVGDVVTLPEHESIFKSLKVENKGKVTATERGVSTVDVGGHVFTVPNRTVKILERAPKVTA